MSCNCKPEPLAIYAERDDYTMNHCYDCKHFDGVHHCTRYRSMVTGGYAIVECLVARSNESLCGCLGVHWEKKE